MALLYRELLYAIVCFFRGEEGGHIALPPEKGIAPLKWAMMNGILTQPLTNNLILTNIIISGGTNNELYVYVIMSPPHFVSSPSKFQCLPLFHARVGLAWYSV